MNTFRYVVGVLLVIGIPPGLTWWFLVHPFVGFWRGLGARTTMVVMTGYFVVGLVGLFWIRDRLLGPDLGLRWPLFGIGVALCLTAAVLERKRRRYLTIRILVGVPEVQAAAEDRGELLDQGPYAVMRHPRYAEIVFAVFGYAAMSNYLGCWIVAVLSLPVLHLVVILEERELTARFGDAYRDYAARVPRYLPRRRDRTRAV